MNIVITGSRGFIGSHLKTKLEKYGNEIIEMTRWIETTPDIMQCFNCDFTGTMKELVEHQSVCPILTENVRILLQEEGENDEQ